MTQPPSSPVIAVDGGGSHCRLALHTPSREIQVQVGSANVSTDFTAALAQLTSGLNQLAQTADVPFSELINIPAYLGLAGVTGPAMAQRVAQALPLTAVKVEEDRAAALRGALGTSDGYIAHCGTGSFLASQLGQTMRFIGGWGPVLGDPASAHWVGRQALSRTLQTVDGLRAPSGLSQEMLNQFGDAAQIVAWAATARQHEIAALAQDVTEHAAQSDPLARQIVQDAASLLARDLYAMGWHTDLALCLTGGLGPCYASYLPPDMRAALCAAKDTPLTGAIALAHDFAQVYHDATPKE